MHTGHLANQQSIGLILFPTNRKLSLFLNVGSKLGTGSLGIVNILRVLEQQLLGKLNNRGAEPQVYHALKFFLCKKKVKMGNALSQYYFLHTVHFTKQLLPSLLAKPLEKKIGLFLPLFLQLQLQDLNQTAPNYVC